MLAQKAEAILSRMQKNRGRAKRGLKILVYLYITRILGALAFGKYFPPWGPRPPGALFLAVLFASCFLSVPSSGFRVPVSAKVGIFDTFSVTFRGPGAHARTELSLQSQHDLAGSGRSKNRCFLLFPWGREKKGI